jgi:hypothetical protein
MNSPLIAFYMHTVYIIIGTQNEIRTTELYKLTVILPVKAQCTKGVCYMKLVAL